jgi:hypothetical protein
MGEKRMCSASVERQEGERERPAEDLHMHKKIILKWILEQQDGVV